MPLTGPVLSVALTPHGAAVIWPLRNGGRDQRRPVLFALAFYCAASSVIDLLAFTNEIVGAAAVPSVIVPLAVAGVCVYAAVARDDAEPQR